MTNTAFKNLPPNTVKEVSDRTGLSRPLVSQVLNGKSNSIHKALILQTAAEYIKQVREKESQAIEAIKEAISIPGRKLADIEQS